MRWYTLYQGRHMGPFSRKRRLEENTLKCGIDLSFKSILPVAHSGFFNGGGG